MASIQLQPLEQFRTSTGLLATSEQQQMNTLFYCLGPDTEDILWTTEISSAERDKNDSVIERFDKHFSVKKNVIYERARFNTCRQQHGKTGEQYILAHYAQLRIATTAQNRRSMKHATVSLSAFGTQNWHRSYRSIPS